MVNSRKYAIDHNQFPSLLQFRFKLMWSAKWVSEEYLKVSSQFLFLVFLNVMFKTAKRLFFIFNLPITEASFSLWKTPMGEVIHLGFNWIMESSTECWRDNYTRNKAFTHLWIKYILKIRYFSETLIKIPLSFERNAKNKHFIIKSKELTNI